MRERSESLRDRLDPKYWAFRVMAALVPLAPLWLARRIAVAAGALLWLCAPTLRHRAYDNLAHIPTLAHDSRRLRAATRGVFITMALNYLDFFRGRFVTYEELGRGWRIKDWDEFERILASGRGAIVLGAHIGPFEYSAWKMGELGYPIVTPAERLRPERFNRLVGSLRNHHEARLLPGDERETLREVLSALRNGQVAVFAVDRWIMGPSDNWPLFGQPARLPTTPFALAARSEAPVLLLTSWREGLDQFGAVAHVISPGRTPAAADSATGERLPGASSRARDREASIAAMRQGAYDLIEEVIRAHPDQWVSALSRVWESAESQQTAAEAPSHPTSDETTMQKETSAAPGEPAVTPIVQRL